MSGDSLLSFTDEEIDDLAAIARTYIARTVPGESDTTDRRRVLAGRLILEAL